MERWGFNRILKVTDTHVTFSWLNRKAGHRKEIETLLGVVFLERFLDHIVPPYFRRIRQMGFLNNRNKKVAIEKIRRQLLTRYSTHPRLTRAQVLAQRFGERSVLKCRECGGELHLIESFTKQRAPPAHRCAKTSFYIYDGTGIMHPISVAGKGMPESPIF
jgi:hypothetical protein